ncbi:MAG: flagellar biosynthesis anti-sigma factor FlgM [Bdellovibrionales bacterium]|nr:flagellar biosynthesis anti-sigma factor FlgM [Bdellovibrionales bacterium]
MKISDLFKSSSLASQSSAQRTEENPAAQQQRVNESATNGEDTVSISPLARQFQQVSQILAEDETRTASRVEELKAQVAAGTFEVDSGEVAKSIVAFARDNQL